jgi:hypothetical protein
MSEAVSTSPAIAPSPEPTCEASMEPMALPSMPRIGPLIAAASAGRALPSAPTDDAAIGSTSTFQTSVVPTTHSARLQAAVEVTPEAKPVVSSSHRSARRTASATSSRCFCEGVGSDCCATVLRAMSTAKSQLSGPSYGCIIDWIWLKSWPRSGAPPPKSCSNGVPRNGLVPSEGPSWPSSGGWLVMSPRYAVDG